MTKKDDEIIENETTIVINKKTDANTSDDDGTCPECGSELGLFDHCDECNRDNDCSLCGGDLDGDGRCIDCDGEEA